MRLRIGCRLLHSLSQRKMPIHGGGKDGWVFDKFAACTLVWAIKQRFSSIAISGLELYICMLICLSSAAVCAERVYLGRQISPLGVIYEHIAHFSSAIPSISKMNPRDLLFAKIITIRD